MSTLKTVARTLVTTVLLFPQFASGIETNCPWMLEQLMGSKTTKGMEPSTKLALQDILRGIYENPPAPGKSVRSKTSVADDDWLDRFQLWNHAEMLAELGREKLKAKRALERRLWLRKWTVGGILALSTPVVYAAWQAATTGGGNPLRRFNWEHGANVQYAQHQQLEMLEKMADCDPVGAHLSLRTRMRHNNKMNQTASFDNADELSESMVSKGANNRDGENLLRIYAQAGVVFCTRWGKSSQELPDSEVYEPLADAVAGTGLSQYFKGLGIVWETSEFHQVLPTDFPYDASELDPHFRYDPQTDRIYAHAPSYRMNQRGIGAFWYSIAQALWPRLAESHRQSIAEWVAPSEAWFPGFEALASFFQDTSAPQANRERFALAVACHQNETCREKLGKSRPELVKYLDDLLTAPYDPSKGGQGQ